MGYDTIANARICFKDKQFIEKLTVGYLIDVSSWIFPPESVRVIVNKRDTITAEIRQLVNESSLQLADVVVNIGKEVNNIDILVKNQTKIPNWHPGKGLNAWLFMDEWIFN